MSTLCAGRRINRHRNIRIFTSMANNIYLSSSVIKNICEIIEYHFEKPQQFVHYICMYSHITIYALQKGGSFDTI